MKSHEGDLNLQQSKETASSDLPQRHNRVLHFCATLESLLSWVIFRMEIRQLYNP